MPAIDGLREAVPNMTAYVSELWRLRHFWMALVRNNSRSRFSKEPGRRSERSGQAC